MGGCIHRRLGQRGEPGPLVGVPVTSCWSRWRGWSSDGASVPVHGGRRRRGGEQMALVRINGPHSKTLSNHCRRRRRRWDGTGMPVIVARRAVRTGSEFLIVINYPIAIPLAVTTIRVTRPSWGRRRWRWRRVSMHAASVGRLRPLHWVGRIKASSAWRRWIALLLWGPSGSAF